MSRLVVSADAASRIEAAADWLKARPKDVETLLIAPTWEAGDDLLRRVVFEDGTRFGVTRLTMDRLAARLAAPELSATGRAVASSFSLAAVAARAVYSLHEAERLEYFRPVANLPGFPWALAATAEELRMNQVEVSALIGLADLGHDLGLLLEEIDLQLASTALADRALVFKAALEVLERNAAPSWVARSLLLFDIAITSRLEASLAAALASQATDVFATAPWGDKRSIEVLERALSRTPEVIEHTSPSSLGALKKHVFEETTPTLASIDESVVFHSWPGESREATEIARAIQEEASHGLPFDRIAILLRSPGTYQAHLEEALRRAAIPAFFASGARRPDPGGRALLSLLRCASENLSARRFAEYLSLGQVPLSSVSGGRTEWVPPAHELLPGPEPRELVPAGASTGDATPEDTAELQTEDSLQAPWRWEDLILDAAIIGGKDRWERRLRGLEEELRLQRSELSDEQEARSVLLDRRIRSLMDLRRFALPIIEMLAGLPRPATWAQWLKHIRALASAALRRPEPVLSAITELEPMGPIGPIDLDEVELVLSPRLSNLAIPPPRRRYGAVFVAPADSARGLCFDVVFVAGLAEKLFPRKIVEDPILLDARRQDLKVPELTTKSDRAAAERLALRLVVGAARARVYLSYPRVDLEQARPRVPSFYGLEAFRAAEGELPSFDELARRGEAQTETRLGWPAPKKAEDAVDEAEYDLAVLARLLESDPMTTSGTARYLLTANPHLGRALRSRARRWLRRWTAADGLVDPDRNAREALAAHHVSSRSFSPTALQNFAVCPYKFFLQAVQRLEPFEEPVALEVIDPFTRGALFHEVQFDLLTKLKTRGLLPIRGSGLDEVLSIAAESFGEVARRYEEKLAPAVARVWEDGLAGIGADIREWLRREAQNDSGWEPFRFEFSFGLANRERTYSDPESVPEPVTILGNLKLRGSIDLVERRAGGMLRATDHKTGKPRAPERVVVGGGQVLQPLLYALACESLFSQTVECGRLYYCTADGGYQTRVVSLDDESRVTGERAVAIIGRALESGFLPAYPARDACNWCDYRPVCGPNEAVRTRRKPPDRMAELRELRSLP